MTGPYKVIGSEISPYSIKVRSWLRFKAIDFDWIVASAAARERYANYFRIPVIPVVIAPNDVGLQDSTPIIEQLENEFSDNTIHPDDELLWFLSCLLEEFGDEWANKWMFHFRWTREADQLNAATRIVATRDPNADADDLAQRVAAVIQRMTDRVWFVGSNEQNAGQIETGFKHALAQLNTHLATRKYLFGDRPAFADFGIAPQLYNALVDPTPGAMISAKFHQVSAWLQRMLWPRVEGRFERWETLAPTLEPFLADQVGARFLPWSVANRNALRRKADVFDVELAGQTWSQKPQKYHAKSLSVLQTKYANIVDGQRLDGVLQRTDCLGYLRDIARNA
ncbi:MAG: glutathione S-transferase family protein [Pseudomonadota bacterium]